MSMEEYDAKWSVDAGGHISVETPIGPDCAPSCTEDFHLC